MVWLFFFRGRARWFGRGTLARKGSLRGGEIQARFGHAGQLAGFRLGSSNGLARDCFCFFRRVVLGRKLLCRGLVAFGFNVKRLRSRGGLSGGGALLT